MFVNILRVLLLVIPACATVLGYVCWRCPPKGPTWAFGFRSRRARASDESWQFAQALAGRIWFCLGLVLLVVALSVAMGLRGETIEADFRTAMICIVVEVVCILLSLVPTQVLLLRRFSRFGRPKSAGLPPRQPEEEVYDKTGRLPQDLQEPVDTLPFLDEPWEEGGLDGEQPPAFHWSDGAYPEVFDDAFTAPEREDLDGGFPADDRKG